MNILLTHGYFIKEDVKEQAIMRPYPPLGILYVSAYLEQNGYDNTIFDTTFSTFIELQTYLLEHKPRYLMVYVNLMTKLNVIKIMEFVKKESSLQNTTIILGGPEVRYHTDAFLSHHADYIVIGEGEQTALALIEALDRDEKPDFSTIDGIAFMGSNGEVVTTKERSKIKEIDTLPLPNRKKINLFDYLNTWKQFHGQSTLSVSTMRGCPYTCQWCSRGVYGLSYRRRSPQKVVEELQELAKIYQPDSIWFVDDVFTVSHKWLAAFRDAIVASGLKIPFECITRADRMNEDVTEMLKEAGCFRVWIGAESGSQKIIDRMDRRVDVHKVREMIRLTRQKGMQAGTFIMLGYPGETETDIEETITHLKASNPDHFTITIAYPIKGTGLYQEIESIQTTQLDWATSTDRDIDFVRTYPRKYYDWAVRRVVNEVNFHKKVLNKKALSLKGASYKLRSITAKAGMWWERKKKLTTHLF